MKFQNLLRISLPMLVIGSGVLAWHFLKEPVEPPAPEKRERRQLQTEIIVLNRQDFQITLNSQGTVSSTNSTTLTPLVTGTITAIHPSFEDGAFFKKGEVLLTLDPADFQTAVLSSESQLARAEANLIQEEAKAEQAELNWKDIGFKEKPSSLVLRIPQLKEARANVSSATADLEQAKRNLSRTEVKAPFAGRVAERLVGLGQAVGATTSLGEIFGSVTAEIRLPLAPAQLDFIKLPKGPGSQSVSVVLTDPLESETVESPKTWTANIVRTEGTLNPDSRELFAIARIEDPFSLSTEKAQLRIGQPLRAEIDGIILSDVFVIPRQNMRGLNRIYLVDRETPKIIRKAITPIWSNDKFVVISEDLEPGDQLAISPLPYAPEGAPVEILSTEEPVEVSETEKKKSSETS